MSKAEFKENSDLPELYFGGFDHSTEIVETIIRRFSAHIPANVYYPGSSTDISLHLAPDARVVHADSNFTASDLRALEAVGAEAHSVDVHRWQPPTVFDVVAFVNSSRIDQEVVLSNAVLRPHGLVIWYSWFGRPTDLQAMKNLKPIAAISFDDKGDYQMHEDDLDDYLSLKSYKELTREEQINFALKLDGYMKTNNVILSDHVGAEDVYSAWQQPENRETALLAGVSFFAYRKDASLFVFQKV